ncbi:hypothetical protein [Blastococcus sp. SYSU D00868]
MGILGIGVLADAAVVLLEVPAAGAATLGVDDRLRRGGLARGLLGGGLRRRPGGLLGGEPGGGLLLGGLLRGGGALRLGRGARVGGRGRGQRLQLGLDAVLRSAGRVGEDGVERGRRGG